MTCHVPESQWVLDVVGFREVDRGGAGWAENAMAADRVSE